MAALHANTVEAPVYWEQMEAQPGKFDFSSVDAIVDGARATTSASCSLVRHLEKRQHALRAHLVKNDTKRFPRVIRPDGEPIDVLSPLSRNTLDADKAAFVALTHHLKEIDGDKHTVIVIQVRTSRAT